VFVHFAKTAEAIEVPFEAVNRVGPRNGVDGGPDLPREIGLWGSQFRVHSGFFLRRSLCPN